VPLYQVDRFLRQYFGDGTGPRRLDLDGQVCQVVFDGPDIVGAFAGYPEGDTFVAPRIAVAEDYRSGCVTPMLIGEGCIAGHKKGMTKIGMYTDERAFPGMVRIARRLGADQVRTSCLMALPLVAPWPVED